MLFHQVIRRRTACSHKAEAQTPFALPKQDKRRLRSLSFKTLTELPRRELPQASHRCLAAALRFVNALRRSWIFAECFHRTTRTRLKLSGATGALATVALRAGHAERPLKGADPRFGGSWWQVFVATLTARSHLKHRISYQLVVGGRKHRQPIRINIAWCFGFEPRPSSLRCSSAKQESRAVSPAPSQG